MARQALNGHSIDSFAPPNTGLSPDFGDTWNAVLAKLNAMLAELYAGGGGEIGIPRIITAAGTIVVAASDSAIILNKAAPSATAITLPTLASRLRTPPTI